MTDTSPTTTVASLTTFAFTVLMRRTCRPTAGGCACGAGELDLMARLKRKDTRGELRVLLKPR